MAMTKKERAETLAALREMLRRMVGVAAEEATP